MSRNTVILVILVYVIIFFVYAATSPDPTDWNKNYRTADTQPFDTKVLYDEIDAVLKPAEKKITRLPISNTFLSDTINNSIFLDIGLHFNIAELDLSALLSFVERGNDAFISASSIPPVLIDTLGLNSYQDVMPPVEWTPNGPIAATEVSVTSLPDSTFMALTEFGYNYFIEFESDSIEQLGMAGDSNVIFVKVPYGDGNIYLHFIPSVFTNYYMLYSDMPKYVAASLSYLPQGKTLYWSDYRPGESGRGGPLGVVGRSQGFRIAYWLSLAGVLLFIFFTAKRRQRMVPVVNPPRNTGLDFVNTMGDLYFNSKNHKDLVDKKFTYFKDHVRTKYRMSADVIDESYLSRLAAKSNKPIEQIKQLLASFRTLKEKKSVSSSDILELQHKIDTFYERD